jgi:transcriptional regulator with XRE-family HTH domain
MEPSGKVIRSLREALHMSQAEFAKAAGWSVSTISSWERGRATPSRLAFKTILAFAEAHGVRYQVPGDQSASGVQSTLPVLRLSSRLPTMPTVEVLDASVPIPMPEFPRDESFGSRRWTAVAGEGLAARSESRVTVSAERAGWKAEADFRLAIGRRATPRRSGYIAAAAALLLGVGVGTLWQTSSAPPASVARNLDRGRDAAQVEPAAAPAPVAALAPADFAPDIEIEEIPQPWHEAPEFAAPAAELAPGVAAATAASHAAAATAPALRLARLESIIALDGIRRASFRVGDRSITLVEGDQLGARAIALIGNDEVTLVGSGEAMRVRLGFETPLALE